MKTVHLDKNKPDIAGEDNLALAKRAETDGVIEDAIRYYKKALKENYKKELIYKRLLILYRKANEPEKEMQLLNTAIIDFKKIFSARKTNHSASIKNISEKIMKATGLTDKKGNALFYPQPLQGWIKRKELLEKRKR